MNLPQFAAADDVECEGAKVSIDIWSGLGLVPFAAMVAYVVVYKPMAMTWLVLVPLLCLAFAGFVSNAALSVLDGLWANQPRYMSGAIIAVLSVIGTALVLRIDHSIKKRSVAQEADKPGAQ